MKSEPLPVLPEEVLRTMQLIEAVRESDAICIYRGIGAKHRDLSGSNHYIERKKNITRQDQSFNLTWSTSLNVK
ncbi:MAG: hypothetical protein FVQ80_17665 [Planctomycetes bacterium]|nr:hypothetical protein [Planctomycetota bacterium]